MNQDQSNKPNPSASHVERLQPTPDLKADQALRPCPFCVNNTVEMYADHIRGLIAERDNPQRDILNYDDYLKGQLAAAKELIAMRG